MTAEPNLSHEEWEALVAASALHALEPDEAQRLSIHVADCERCRRLMDDYALVGAQLASLAEGEARPPNWAAIRSRVIEDDAHRHAETAPRVRCVGPRTAGETGQILPAPRAQEPVRAWRKARPFAIAVVLVGLLSAGVAGWQLGKSSGPTSITAALTACQRQAGCRVIRLHDARSNHGADDSAAVVVQSDHASLVPLGLSALPADRAYVLWQLPRDGGPVPIETFRRTSQETGGSALIKSYADTAAFAVSVEPAGSTPSRPSDILALGAAPS